MIDPLDRPLWSGFAAWKIRLKTIWYCLYFGILPWWKYETKCHYEGWSYGKHLWVNILYMLKWVFFLETEEDRDFEEQINNN